MRRLRVKFRGYSVTGDAAAFAVSGQAATLSLGGATINGSFTLAQTNLDATTWSAYSAAITATERAAIVVDRIGYVSGVAQAVTVEIRDGSGNLRASGTMAAPWATSSGSTITVGEVNASGITVSSGGVPDANWYCQFKGANGRFVRGTFGVSTDTADFKWTLATFQTGSKGTIGTATLFATGTSGPVSGWQGGSGAPVITLTSALPNAQAGVSYSYGIPFTGSLPTTFTMATVSGSAPSTELPTGITLDASTGALVGTELSGGRYQFKITAENGFGSWVSYWSLDVTPVPVVIIQDDIWFGVIGEPYEQQFTANGTGPITWSASGLPSGMTMSSSGLLSQGTVTGSAGDTTITVTATGAAGAVSKQFKLTKLAKLSTRIHKTDLTYKGAFKLPDHANLFDAGNNGRGSGIAVTNSGTMFVAGRASATLPVCEITIPALVNSTSLSALNRASYTQTWADAIEGNKAAISASTGDTHICSLLWLSGGTLLVHAGYFYDQTQSAYKAFKRPANLSSTGAVVGPAQLKDGINPSARAHAGYMTAVPSAAQTAYSIGPVLTGGRVGSIPAGDSSIGPGGMAFDPASLTGTSTVTGTRALFYPWISTADLSRTLPYLFSQPGVAHLLPDTHQNKWVNAYVTQVSGAAWINSGTRKSLLFFQKHGMGLPWYGAYERNNLTGSSITEGGAFKNSGANASGNFRQLTVDTLETAQGGHAYPYRILVIAYDESEIAAVIAGSKNAWEATPYDVWEMEYPFDNGYMGNIHGVAHDSTNRRIYLSVYGQDTGSGNQVPVVHVYEYPAS